MLGAWLRIDAENGCCVVFACDPRALCKLPGSEVIKRDSPSPESANRPPNGCDKRLLLSQRGAGLETAAAIVDHPERWAEDARCHWYLKANLYIRLRESGSVEVFVEGVDVKAACLLVT